MIQINVTLTAANTNYNLLTLIKALKDGTDTKWEIDSVKQIQVQMDPEAAGAVWRRGGSDLSDTVYAAKFGTGDFDTWGPLGNDGINLSDFYYRCDGAGKILRVSFVTQ